MTIRDIARECGVSVSTVSRVLNNRPDVSEAVRRQVLSVVERQGYIPNNSARDLVRSQSDAIGVVVRGTGTCFSPICSRLSPGRSTLRAVPWSSGRSTPTLTR